MLKQFGTGDSVYKLYFTEEELALDAKCLLLGVHILRSTSLTKDGKHKWFIGSVGGPALRTLDGAFIYFKSPQAAFDAWVEKHGNRQKG